MGKRGRGARKREGKGEGTRGLVWVPRAKGWMDGCECNCLIGETAYAVIDETVRAEAHPSPPGVASMPALRAVFPTSHGTTPERASNWIGRYK